MNTSKDFHMGNPDKPLEFYITCQELKNSEESPYEYMIRTYHQDAHRHRDVYHYHKQLLCGTHPSVIVS